MALTNDELTELVQKLQGELATLQQEVKQYRQDILELEQQFSQSITTQEVKAKQLKAEIVDVKNIRVDELIGGACLPPNLIRNSYMNLLTGSKPAGYSATGNVTLETVHPFTKGFEGPYIDKQPDGAASKVDEATAANPFWFGVYDKGIRANRGGLADGWHTTPDGKILKITGNNSGEHTFVSFPFERNVLANKLRFKAWLKITSGKQVGFGVDAGYQNVVRGLVITKAQADASEDGWYQIDAVVAVSEVTSLDNLAFSMGIEAEAGGEFEVYLALPYVANVDNDTWLPSVSDMLSRDGLTIHPETNKIGIGIEAPEEKLHLNGAIRGDQAGALRISTGNGYVDVGPQNTEWSHFSTDRPLYYFNTGIRVDTGNISSYDEDLNLMTEGTPRITIRKDNGDVGVGTGNPGFTLDVEGTVGVGGRITLRGSDPTVYSPGRMHLDGEERLFILNKQGAIVSKAAGGNGNLVVEGEIQGKPWYSKEFALAVPNTGSTVAVKMLPANKCFAFITLVAGSFAGSGEQVWVEVRSDGFWYLCGHALQDGVSVRARCVGMP